MRTGDHDELERFALERCAIVGVVLRWWERGYILGTEVRTSQTGGKDDVVN